MTIHLPVRRVDLALPALTGIEVMRIRAPGAPALVA
jgi:hypothetical protein